MSLMQWLFGRRYNPVTFLQQCNSALDKVAADAQLTPTQRRFVALAARLHLEHGRNERALNEALVEAFRRVPTAEKEAVIGLPAQLRHDFLNAVSALAKPYGLKRSAVLDILERIDGAARGPNERSRDTDRLLEAMRDAAR
jgi:hypothetical protein